MAWPQASSYPLLSVSTLLPTSESECRDKILGVWEGKRTRVCLSGNQSYLNWSYLGEVYKKPMGAQNGAVERGSGVGKEGLFLPECTAQICCMGSQCPHSPGRVIQALPFLGTSSHHRHLWGLKKGAMA